MYLSKYASKLLILLIGALVVFIANLPYAALADDTKNSVEDEYAKFLDQERAFVDKDKSIEFIASGAAATFVGVYGYYFDDRGVLAKAAYIGTQTAGIFVVGEGIKRLYSKSLFVEMDPLISTSDPNRMKETLAKAHKQNIRAKQRADAWTAGLLGSLYAYNAYREESSIANIRNIYLFLSANAFAVSGYNTYQLWVDQDSHVANLSIGVETLNFTFQF